LPQADGGGAHVRVEIEVRFDLLDREVDDSVDSPRLAHVKDRYVGYKLLDEAEVALAVG
jgi:hypothetical protein